MEIKPYVHDMALHVVLRQPTLNTTTQTFSDQPTMRWCDFPGERLLKNVRFEVNANPLDEYTSYATNFHRLFSVQPNKKVGWNRLVGQEEPLNGWVDQPNWVRSGVAAAEINHRAVAQVDVGNQTPTGQKLQDLEMIVPLLFWFNRDPRRKRT